MTLVSKVIERTSALYTAGPLKDQTGAVVPGASLLTLTLTLTEKVSKATVNSRNAQNVLNTNNVTVDSAGLLTWQIQPADVALVNNRIGSEFHIAVFAGTWNGGGFTHTVILEVEAAGQ